MKKFKLQNLLIFIIPIFIWGGSFSLANKETPENVIFTDKPIQIIVGVWLLIIIYVGLFT